MVALVLYIFKSLQQYKAVNKVKLHSVGVFFPLLLNASPKKGRGPKALKRVGHLDAVFPHLDLLRQLKIPKQESYVTLHAG
ncbi:hypothetical protein D1839_01590 [Roseburia sp. 1XD42-34]|nr:hypothetical protein [Roseburia sp. 1XD42-34]RKI81944.1 hypothetical protein D7V87_01590 [Clostridium sp. 1xD42-85]